MIDALQELKELSQNKFSTLWTYKGVGLYVDEKVGTTFLKTYVIACIANPQHTEEEIFETVVLRIYESQHMSWWVMEHNRKLLPSSN